MIRSTRAEEMRMARGMAMERLCYQMATYMSVNIITGLDMVKVFMYLKTVPDITAIGDMDRNMVKGFFGSLTERDTKVRKNIYIYIRFESDSKKLHCRHMDTSC